MLVPAVEVLCMAGGDFCSALCARKAAKKLAKKGRLVVGIVSNV